MPWLQGAPCGAYSFSAELTFEYSAKRIINDLCRSTQQSKHNMQNLRRNGENTIRVHIFT